MRFISQVAAVIVALSVAAFPVFAQGRGNGQAKKHANTHAPKTTTKAGTRPAKTETRTAKADPGAKQNRPATKAKGTATSTPVPVSTVTPTTPTTQAVKNPKLEARLQTMLPSDLLVQDAKAGFKNWGQFVAAVHVSNNLGIPFADLKAKMTGLAPGPMPGTTVQGTSMSLGQAIQSLKGVATVPEGGTSLTTTRINREVKKAEEAASTDLRQSRERS